MNFWRFKKLICLVIIIGSLFIGHIQVSNAGLVEDLQAQINAKQKEIERLEAIAATYQATIKTKKSEEKSLKSEISIYNNEIAKLEVDISVTENKIDETDLQIKELDLKIQIKEGEIDQGKSNLSSAIRMINEYDQETLLSIMLESDNFSDVFSQMHYIDLLQQEINKQVNDLKFLKREYEEQNTRMRQYKTAQEELKQELGIRQGALAQQRSNKNTLLAKTKGEEARYQKMLNDTIAERNIYFAQIRDLETQIYKEKNFIIHVTATNIPPAGTKLFSMPESKYVLTQGYGMTSYAKKGAYGGSPHNGIDVAGGRGTAVKSIGEGTVIVKGYNSGWGNWVAVQHTNNMVSIYAHMMQSAHAVIGQNVVAGTVLGYEGSTGNSTGSHLHLSIYTDFFTYISKTGELYFNYFQGSINPFNYL